MTPDPLSLPLPKFTITISSADLWEINKHFGIRFSASNLGMIYNQMIAAQGIIDPATNQILVLKAPPPRNGPGPGPFD